MKPGKLLSNASLTMEALSCNFHHCCSLATRKYCNSVVTAVNSCPLYVSNSCQADTAACLTLAHLGPQLAPLLLEAVSKPPDVDTSTSTTAESNSKPRHTYTTHTSAPSLQHQVVHTPAQPVNHCIDRVQQQG
jgi:hypothetical protein